MAVLGIVVRLGVRVVAALEALTVRVLELRELQTQAAAVAVDMAVHQLLRRVQVDQALLLLAPLLRRHLPQVLQPLQQAAAEQFIHLQHLVQLHSEV